ncbi:MAG TPA: LacI family DNA-binding transcriptional regulator [Hyphomicrobiales bacterium]|nr:LacI family DNA-binding transcriptional regulator [Hyphomicrobiales bacterium]
MDKRRATLKDVAEAVGVHVSTASRALHPKTRHLITDALAERILAAARTLDYQPNSIAYSLRTRRSMTVGVLVPDITNPIFPPIVRGLEDVLVPRGYATLVVNTDSNPEKEATYIQMLQGRGVDGLVVASAERRDTALATLLEERLPVVAVNRKAEDPDLWAVVNDEATGIDALVDHLVSLGHKRLAHIAGPQNLSTGFLRRKAFLERIAALGLEWDPRLMAQAERYSEAEGKRACEELLDRGGATAIVAANDLLALGALHALSERGISCPGDVSVTGYNDMPFVDRISPPLTTVRIQSYETGRHAAALILKQMETGESGNPSTEVLPVELVVRGSTGPAKG